MLSAWGWTQPRPPAHPAPSSLMGTLFGTLDTEATASFLPGSFSFEQGRAIRHLRERREGVCSPAAHPGGHTSQEPKLGAEDGCRL